MIAQQRLHATRRECVRMAGVDMEARQGAMHHEAPRGPAVDGEIQGPSGSEHALQLAHPCPYIADMVDAVLHDGEVVAVTLAGERFNRSLPVFHGPVAECCEGDVR